MFTGKVISNIHDLIGCGNHSENYEVICSEPLNIKAEWRCFIMYDQIVDVRPYGLILDSSRESYYYHYDEDLLKEIMRKFRTWEGRPCACSMDICVTEEGKTLLVEFNDAYALRNYGLHGVQYAKLISARWSQLLGREDEYKF